MYGNYVLYIRNEKDVQAHDVFLRRKINYEWVFGNYLLLVVLLSSIGINGA